MGKSVVYMNYEKWLDEAKKISLSSTFKNKKGVTIKVGAIVVHKNKIISNSVNIKKTHPLMQYYNSHLAFSRIPFLHAEMSALLKAKWELNEKQLKNCTIFIARKLNCSGYGYARPCPACMAAIKDIGIKEIVYTTENGYAIERIKN